MKTIFGLLILILSLTSFAQDITCFESSVLNEEYSTKICLSDFGKKKEITATGFFTGFSDLAGFEDSKIKLKELKRGRTIKGEHGIYFVADLQDGESSKKNILAVGQGFKGCEELWKKFP